MCSTKIFGRRRSILGKHTTYHEVQDAITEGGCPICLLVLQEQERSRCLWAMSDTCGGVR